MVNRFRILASPRYIIVASIVLICGYFLYQSSQYNYLLFHSLSELFSIIIAVSIFLLSWNARRFLQNDYILFVGVSQLFVALLDILHMLSYTGMNIFTGYDTNLPTQLWIAARYWQSLSFLAAVFYVRRKLKPFTLFVIYSILFALLLGSIFYWDLFPASYIEGVGQTAFKLTSEYIIDGIYLLALVGLISRRQYFSRVMLRWMVLAIVASILAELALTFYVSVYDFSNLVGHYLKIAAFYFLYKAIVETGLVKPYELLFHDLVQNEEALRRSRDELQRINEELIDANRKLLEANEATQAENEERQRAEQTLATYAARLEQRNKELEQFAFVASHDLQEPLRKIRAFGGMLESRIAPKLDEKEKDLLNRMTNAAQRMQKMINDLLELSRVTTRGKPFQEVDLSQVVSEVVSELELRIQESGGRVEQEALPVIRGDSVQIHTLLLNLIGNALKYHKPGVPPVVRVRGRVERDSQLRLEIQDNGIGFDMKYLDKIFQPFQRLHGRSEYDGNGMGLAICRKIVERHGGELTAESTPDCGSTFIVSLPLGDGTSKISESHSTN